MSRLLRRATAPVATLTAIAASVLIPLPARAEETELQSDGVLVTVQIDPLPCTTGCGGPPLPATGIEAPDVLVWIAAALLVAGLAFALRGRVIGAREARMPSVPPTPYAEFSGDRPPKTTGDGSASSSSAASSGPPAGRRESERGGGTCQNR